MSKISMTYDITKELENGRLTETTATNGETVYILRDAIQINTRKIGVELYIPAAYKDKVVTVAIEDRSAWWQS